MKADTTVIGEATKRLGLLKEEFPYLGGVAEIYEAILPLVLDADLHVGAVPISPDEVLSKLERGVHVLSGLEMEVDVGDISELMIKLCNAVESSAKDRPSLVKAARLIRTAVEGSELDIGGVLLQVASGEYGPVSAKAAELGLDPDLLRTLAMNSIRPAMRAWRSQLEPLPAGARWDKGFCPVCGAPAMLGELQGDTQERHLRCGECGADWRVRRLACVCCGNEDHTTLGYIRQETAGNSQLEVCDKCGSYIKVVSSFSAAKPEMLPIEDLATLHLDYIAEREGYLRAGGRRSSSSDKRDRSRSAALKTSI